MAEGRIGVPLHLAGHGVGDRGGGGRRREEGGGIHFATPPPPCWNIRTRTSSLPLPRDGQEVIGMWVRRGRQQEDRGGSRMRRRRRVLFRKLICKTRGLIPPTPTRDDAAQCGVCFLPAHDPSTDGAVSAPGTSSETKMSAGGGSGGNAHESEKLLISFSGSKLYRHLHHVDANRAEAMEGLFVLLLAEWKGLGRERDLGRGR